MTTRWLVGNADEMIASFDLHAGRRFGPHKHRQVQLAWSDVGSMLVACGDDSWVVGPGTGVWIPAGLYHDVIALSEQCRLRSVYVRETAIGQVRAPWLPDGCEGVSEPALVQVEPLLTAIVDAIYRCDGPVVENEQLRLEAVLFDRLRTNLRNPACPSGRQPLPLPSEGPALAVARLLLDEPGDTRDLTAWGEAVGASARTLRRRWTADTGMPFQDWRLGVRMQHAVALLEAGGSVETTARDVGYQSPSAFTSAFKGWFGTSPRDHKPAPGA